MNKKLKSGLSYLPYLPQIIWFNFHYLPWRQAIKLPIFLYRAKILRAKGSITITGNVFTGMIRLGERTVSLFPNRGFVWENHGGKCSFAGKCHIGNASGISIGEHGNLTFGNNFVSTTTLKLISYHRVEFKDNVLIGWDAIIMDTDFHRMKNHETGTFTKGYAPVLIGQNCWIGSRCTILKGTNLPAYCTLAAGTTIGKKIEGGYQILSNTSEIKTLKTGYYRELSEDVIVYPVTH
jgi:acetyltransferase-like isoleucine patch superfamily enzyme